MRGQFRATFKGAKAVQQAAKCDASYTVYVLSVEAEAHRYLVFRRYREWHKLHEQLSALYANVPAIPGKTLFGLGALSQGVIEARTRGLQTFLEACLSHVEISGSDVFADFFLEEAQPKGLQDSDDLKDAGHCGQAEGAVSSEQTTVSEMAERAANAFIDLEDMSLMNYEMEPLAMQQRKALYAPVVHAALERPSTLLSGYAAPAVSGGADFTADRIAALGARPALSAADRALARLAAGALAEAVAGSSAFSATSNLLVKVP
ncbi:Phox homologous domain-containing protein [Pavlovales sp. CCMP2436]|nr:Phox homologous domain-containing protein [Pavlovales sp. CCMP2436]